MGAEASKCDSEDTAKDLAPFVTAPLSNNCTQIQFFTHLHQTLTVGSASLANGTIAPFSLRKGVQLFSPLQTNGYEGQKINFVEHSLQEFYDCFPNSTDVKINGIEVGPITDDYLVDTPIQKFSVKLLFDGALLSYGFQFIENTNSFFYKPLSLQFEMTIDTSLAGYNFYRIRKTNNQTEGEFIIAKVSSARAKVTEEQIVEKIPVHSYHGKMAVDYMEEVQVSCFRDYMLSRFTTMDLRKCEYPPLFQSTTQEPVKVRIKLNRLHFIKGPKKWSFSSPSATSVQIEAGHLFIPLNGNKCFVTSADTAASEYSSSCTFWTYIKDPEAQQVAIQLFGHGFSSLCTLTITKPLNKNHYLNPSAPAEFQSLDIKPIQSLGSWPVKSPFTPAANNNKFEAPPFLRNFCTVLIESKVKLHGSINQQSFEITSETPPNMCVSEKPKFGFLLFKITPYKKTSYCTVSIRLAHSKEQLSTLELFKGEVDKLSQALQHQTKIPIYKPSLGGILERSSFLRYMGKSDIAALTEKLKQYSVIGTRSTVDFVSQIFELKLELYDKYGRTCQQSLVATLTLDFEKMRARVVEKEELGIDLEYGILSSKHIYLPDALWETKHLSNHYYTDLVVIQH